MEQEEKIGTYHTQDNSNIEGTAMAAAQKHYLNGDYREALKVYLGPLHLVSDSETYLEIGNCYFMLKEYASAIEYWNKAIGLNPKNSKAYSNMGNLYYKLGQTEKAISFWIVSSISKPEDPQTCLNLGIAFNEKSMRFESIKYFEKYLKYSEDTHSENYLNIKQKIQNCQSVAEKFLEFGVQCQIGNDDKKAAACYFKSLANYPGFSKTNLNLGSIFFADKNLELAIKYWTAAAHIDPTYDKIYSNLAITYDLMKQFDYAYCYYYRYMNFIINTNKEEYYKTNKRVLKLKTYINKHPELVSRHIEKAQEHLAKNEFYEAIDEFKNYSILKPEDKNLYKDTINKLEIYLNPEVGIIANCFEIGNNLIAEGKYSEAKPYFFRIMKLSSPQYLEFSKAKAKYTYCDKS